MVECQENNASQSRAYLGVCAGLAPTLCSYQFALALFRTYLKSPENLISHVQISILLLLLFCIWGGGGGGGAWRSKFQFLGNKILDPAQAAASDLNTDI